MVVVIIAIIVFMGNIFIMVMVVFLVSGVNIDLLI